MRPALLRAAAFVLACPLMLAAAPAADPTLLLSASINPSAAGAPAGTCPVRLQLRNLKRRSVSIIGRIEGTIGDSDFPSYRTFAFDNVPPGKSASASINFDGDCSRPPAAIQSRGELTLRGLLMCHEGLTSYTDCQNDIAAEPSTDALALPVRIDITDWDPGGVSGQLPKNATILPFTGAPAR